MKKKRWISLLKTNKLYKLELLKSKFFEIGILSVIINKIDSSYLNFGEAELRVQESDFERAQQILKDVK